MVNGAGSLAGAAIGVAFLGVGLGVAAIVVNTTKKQLKVKSRRIPPRSSRLKRSGII